MKKTTVRTILGLSLALSVVPLSGCVPIIAGGFGVGVLMAEDRRTSGTYLLDEEIELKVASRLRESFGKNSHVNTTSFNRRVLLTGEVPDAATRAAIEENAMAVPNVRSIQNELTIGEEATFAARSGDAYLTAKVKVRLLDDKRFNAHQIKVVSESDTVFLMGLVKHAEGNAAAEVAARTGGVSKVVKVFEYID